MGADQASPWTDKLNHLIPWGSSTCSKAPLVAPEEPGVVVRGAGCRVWDDRDREYIDFRNGMGPVTLGYGYGPVADAIRTQLDRGIVFGHPHPLECEVAQMLCDLVPCAEQARFLKTGGEAVAACIRAARTYTGRDHIIQVGYNGWLNSLAHGGLRMPNQPQLEVPPGVPRAVSELHHACAWNDIEAMRKLFNEFDGNIAGVVVAADYRHMADGKTFYPQVRELTEQHGAVLIYDEIVTGFRVALAGVQEYFGVTPDMAVFAKGMANGMPLSAYVGRRDLMNTFERGVVSSTYGGEVLSLAAAKATIQTYAGHHVVDFLWSQARALWTQVNCMLDDRGIAAKLEGFWPCPLWVEQPGAAPTEPGTENLLDRLFRRSFAHGLSFYLASYINFSHKDEDVAETLHRFERVCDDLVETKATAGAV